MRKARFLSSVDHVNLDRLRFRVMQEVGQMMQQVDVLIGPATTGPMLVASNFTGHPCLHLRAGFEHMASRLPGTLGNRTSSGPATTEGPEFRVPMGISLWGQLFDEGPLLAFGMALERALNVASARPGFPQ
jgi:Asp-tRNA(Asn)/Glu-tRNA(Gln) amidotransferase A subunit family amidase